MKSLKYNFLAVAACITVLLFTLYAHNRAVRTIRERRENLFQLRTEQAVTMIVNRITDYTQILKGFQGLYLSCDTVSRAVWRTYYNTLEVNHSYPGIQGIGFVQRVDSAQLAQHESAVRSEGFPGYKVHPRGDREVYYPVVYIEPFSGRNLRAFGYNMYSEAVRQRTMLHAIETNSPTISAKVRLIQETSTNVQPGFLLYLPLYRKGAEDSTVAWRRENVIGFVYAPFRAHDFMNAILSPVYKDIDVEIYDSPLLSPHQLLYDSDQVANHSNKGDDDQLTALDTIIVGQQHWYTYFTTNSNFGSVTDQRQPVIILTSGILMSVLLFFVVAVMANTNRKAIHLAEDMTQKLRSSEARIQNIFRNAPDAVIVIDKESRVLRWNPRAELLFGWAEEEVQGKRIHEFIIPDRYREAHIQGMKRFMATGEGPVINRTIEISAQNRSGEEFEVELSISYTTDNNEIIFIAFISDIRERKRTEAELIRKTVDLAKSRELERKKDEFLGVASHELKTPLTSVKAYIQLLQRQLIEEKCSPVSHNYVQKANNYIDKLNRLISDLLDATKIQSGKLLLNLSEFQVEPFLRECIETMQHVSSRHNIVFEGSASAYVIGDKQRLEQVMVNLLTNAIKYSPVSDKVIVTAERKDTMIKIGVRDFGIGINEDDLAKIFSRFYRVEKDSSQYSGLGLGLYISRQIVERHKGKLWAESIPGQGSVFYFTLPVQQL